ncbi:MAG TPA: hypothetical protein VMP10_02185 [Chloroflexota bacterium]|nr:hypothetical protein [Chloroflexota bacterium]
MSDNGNHQCPWRTHARFGPIYPTFGSFDDGDGIVRFERLGAPHGDGWFWMKVPWASHADYRGPALIRGRQLDGQHDLRFASDRHEAAPALRFPVAPSTLGTNLPEGWRFQPSMIGVRGPGCYALQVDGINFTRLLVFEVVP